MKKTFTMADRLNQVAERHPHFGLFAYGMRKNALQKLKSLKVKWLNRNNVRQLSWDFACADFINPLSFQASRLPNFRKRCTFAFTMADRLSRLYTLRSKLAFTMAEILISLTIIGVIALITLPSLRANINEKTWATQKKALYSRMSQAISLMPSLNGYGVDPESNSNTTKNAAHAFVTEGLTKVLKINNICDNTHFQNCGIQSKYKAVDGTKRDFPKTIRELHTNLAGNISLYEKSISLINTKAVAFETANGESVVVYYQPNCKYYDVRSSFFQSYMCANFVYDLNGKRGPNKFGKDIGSMSVFYPMESVVVMPKVHDVDSASNQTVAKANKVCRNAGSDLRLPNKEELASVLINKVISGQNIDDFGYYVATNEKAMLAAWLFYGNAKSWQGNLKVRCLKR